MLLNIIAASPLDEFLTAGECHVSIKTLKPVRTFSDNTNTDFFHLSGAVAQLGARVNGIHEVAGSIPASSTNFFHLSEVSGDVPSLTSGRILSFANLPNFTISGGSGPYLLTGHGAY